MTLIYSFYSDVLSLSKASFPAKSCMRKQSQKKLSAGLTESMAERAAYYYRRHYLLTLWY